MKLIRALLIGVGIFAICTGTLFAQLEDDPPPPPPQPSAADIHVRAATLRPGADYPEAFIEIWNHGTLNYKVRAVRTYTNPAGHQFCSNCPSGSYACGNTPNGAFCVKTNDTTVQVTPWGSGGFCAWSADCMPGGDHPCPSCDNLDALTCTTSIKNTANEFCADYTDLLVTITAYKANFRDPWTDLSGNPIVVCGLGSSGAGHPACPTNNYCQSGPLGQRHVNAMCVLDPILPD